MKAYFIKTTVIVLFLSVSAFSCDLNKLFEKPEPTELPLETKTGENTFGCFVNGELFVAQRGYYSTLGWPHLFANYYKWPNGKKYLEIEANGKQGYIWMTIYHPEENIINTSFRVLAKINKQNYQGNNIFSVRDTITNTLSSIEGYWNGGEIYITKFDTVHEIVSGRFHFNLEKLNYGITDINTYKLDSIGNISQGRFDIKMKIRNLSY